MKKKRLTMHLFCMLTVTAVLCNGIPAYADRNTDYANLNEQNENDKRNTQYERDDMKPIVIEEEIRETTEGTEHDDDLTPEEPRNDGPIEGEIRIEQTPELVYHTVAFDLNGGSGHVVDLSMPHGTTIGVLNTNVSKPGYDFVGWFTDDGIQATSDTVVMDDMHLTAKWEANGTTPYTVIQKTEKLDGSYETYRTCTETDYANATIDVVPEEIEGFDTPQEERLYVNPDGSSSVTLKYERNSYKLDIRTEKGVTSKQKTFNFKYEEPVDLEIYLDDDYTDLTVTGDVNEKRFKMPAKDVSVTVSAEPATYRIKYTGRGIDTRDLQESYSVEMLPVILGKPEITNELYEFNGWTYDNEPITEITDTSHTDMVIKADMSIRWKYVIPPLALILLLLYVIYVLCRRLARISKRQKRMEVDEK